MNYQCEIPYGAYWSTPFCKWQGAFANLHAVEFAGHVAKEQLGRRPELAEQLDFLVFGTTVPQHRSFYGAPWLAALCGLPGLTGPTISQACATGVRTLHAAVMELHSGLSSTALVLTADRCSNGPHVYYPNAAAPGGTGAHEDWVMDNFGHDPVGRNSMLTTAENVAARHGISTAEQHDVALRRFEQYEQAIADQHAFQKRYMPLPFSVPSWRMRETDQTLGGDQGVFPTTAEGLAKLRPVVDGGTVTFGGQTHPADGNAAIIVCAAEKAAELSADPAIRVGIRGFGQSRAEQAYMPEAIVPASKMALEQAGLSIADIDAVKSHNPFAVNDILFSRETGYPLSAMNNFGCSLVWGHPQGPTGTRSIIELIEELAARGGGRGLFQGCAAGDSAMAVVVEVGPR